MMTYAAITILSFVSGAAWGLHEATAHHWEKFRGRFPKASWMFWNPAMSWKNKYKGGNPANGRNKTPIWFTDAAHLLATINQTTILGVGFFLAKTGLVVGVLVCFAAYTIGNELTFKWIYKK